MDIVLFAENVAQGIECSGRADEGVGRVLPQGFCERCQLRGKVGVEGNDLAGRYGVALLKLFEQALRADLYTSFPVYAVVIADDELYAATADVDYKSILQADIERRLYAHIYELGFAVAGDDGNVYTGKDLYAAHHVAAVAGVAHGAGAEREYPGDAGLVYRVPEALHGQKGALYPFLR